MTGAEITAAEYEINSLGYEIRSLRAQKSHLRRWYNEDADEMQYHGAASVRYEELARSAATRLARIAEIDATIGRWTERVAQLKAQIAEAHDKARQRHADRMAADTIRILFAHREMAAFKAELRAKTEAGK